MKPPVAEAPAGADAGASTLAPAPASSGSSAPSTAGSSAVPVPAAWADTLTREEKTAFMRANVKPRLLKAFQAVDAAKYGSFGCKSCHGPQMKTTKEHLPVLTMKGGELTAFKERPQVAKWMAEKVVPEMNVAMGRKDAPDDPRGSKGCGTCHAIEVK